MDTTAVIRYANRRLPFSFTVKDLGNYLARTDLEAESIDVMPWVEEALSSGGIVECEDREGRFYGVGFEGC